MKLPFRKYLAVLLTLPFFLACTNLDPHSTDYLEADKVIPNEKAVTSKDHFVLADYYENVAQEMHAKIDEKKADLEEYDDHSVYYGRQGQELKSHAKGNIRYYEEALEDANEMATMHRETAVRLLQFEKHASPLDIDMNSDQKIIKVKAKARSGEISF